MDCRGEYALQSPIYMLYTSIAPFFSTVSGTLLDWNVHNTVYMLLMSLNCIMTTNFVFDAVGLLLSTAWRPFVDWMREAKYFRYFANSNVVFTLFLLLLSIDVWHTVYYCFSMNTLMFYYLLCVVDTSSLLLFSFGYVEDGPNWFVFTWEIFAS